MPALSIDQLKREAMDGIVRLDASLAECARPLKDTMVGITPTGEFIWELRPAPECDAKYFDRKERK